MTKVCSKCKTIDNTFIREWNSAVEAYKYLEKDITSSGIRACCRHKQKTAYGFIWKYKKENKNV